MRPFSRREDDQTSSASWDILFCQSPKMRNSIYIFLFFFPLYVLSMGGHGYGGVGTTTYSVTRSMLLQKSVAIDPAPWGKFGRDGQFYAQYGIGHSLYNIPFYLVGHGLTKLFPALLPQYDRITMFTTLLGQAFISALTCMLLFCVCRKLGYSLAASTWCAFLYGLGAQVWMYAQLDFSEPILTCCLLGAVYWIYLPDKICGGLKTPQASIHIFLSGLFFGIGVTVKIVALILLPLFLLYILQAYKPDKFLPGTRILLFIAPVLVIGMGIVGLYNLHRFGNPFETGYDNEFNFYYKHVLQQFWNNFLSLEGSIFFYSPVIVLAFPGIIKFYKFFTSFAVFIYGCIVMFFLFYPFTTNELYYGPRYLTPTLPFFMLIAGSSMPKMGKPLQGPARRESRVWWVWFLGILGIVQQVLGVVVNYHTYYWRIHYTLPLAGETLRSSETGQILSSTPVLPHILGHLWLIKHAVLDLFEPGGFPLMGVDLIADATRYNAWVPYYGIDLWWRHPKLLAMTGVIGSGMVVLILISMMGVSLYRIKRS